jgi:23S rRNA (adenine2503-C2)-methyltransferase
MDLQLLDQTLADRGEPPFRARQVWAWIARGASGFEEMTDLAAALRAALARELPFSSLTVAEQAESPDGTVKALFATADGRPLEAVLMRYRSGRRSICLSSQSGCPLTCAFCATGSMRFARNLTASEILDQALHFRRIEPIDHCVFMGMGEPMMNLDAVLAACRISASRTGARRSRPSAGYPASNGSPSRTCRCAWRCRCTPPTKRCAPS